MGGSQNILSIGLGDLVSARNAALRIAGFDVVAAICLEDVFQQCASLHIDLAIVGHGFSFQERAEFVRCIQEVFRLPVILIVEGELFASIRADSHIDVNAPSEELVCAIKRLFGEQQSRAVAV